MPDPANTLGVRLFHRSYKLQVEDYDVTGLQVRFTVRRSLSSKTSNRAEIEVVNLSEATRKRLHAMHAVFCSLEAGYRGATSLIFRGDLVEAWSSREGTDWFTTITSDDGGKARKSKRASFSFPPGTSLERIITGVAGSLGVGRGNVDAIAKGARYVGTKLATVTKGYTASGDAIAALDRAARSAGYEWSIQDNELQFLQVGSTTSDAPVLLTPDTGLVDSPELGKDEHVKARALIIPGLYPGRQVELQSRHTTGVFRIETTTHHGDYNGQNWYCDLELSAVKR